jgi:dTDP-4-amino-4,6-dideoxygalactose transaminase
MTTFVSKIYLPEKQKLKSYIDKIYDSGWLTNNGPLVQELEKRLADYLGVKNLLVVSNGTIGLQLAIKTLALDGEAITTPFTYVATSAALAAENIKPVFTDIQTDTLNMDPSKIEAAITENTSAIIPVHVFGNACAIDQIDAIAKKHNLKVIYDAAHAFDVKFDGNSIFSYGDISMVSFHATKFFHTIEGGAIIIKDDDMYEKAKVLRNYGIDGPESIKYAGFNAKMNEFEAAMGLCNLDEIDLIRAERKRAFEYYQDKLSSHVQLQHYNPRATLNYSYLSVLFKNHEEMDKTRSALKELDIHPRQYFFPSLDATDVYGQENIMNNSRNVVDRILVLPLHSGAEVQVCETILATLAS